MNKQFCGVLILGVAVSAVMFFCFTGGATHTIVRTNEGYEPSALTIARGDTIVFLNQSDDFHWPASDFHPTHGMYPDFDPRRPVAINEVWSFRFKERGEWKFHDHLQANEVGTITVE